MIAMAAAGVSWPRRYAAQGCQGAGEVAHPGCFAALGFELGEETDEEGSWVVRAG